MNTLLNLNLTTVEYILLGIIIYIVQLLITLLLIYLLNKMDNHYGSTNIHYYLPLISVIAYTMIIIEECYIHFIKPALSRVFNRIIKY